MLHGAVLIPLAHGALLQKARLCHNHLASQETAFSCQRVPLLQAELHIRLPLFTGGRKAFLSGLISYREYICQKGMLSQMNTDLHRLVNTHQALHVA